MKTNPCDFYKKKKVHIIFSPGHFHKEKKVLFLFFILLVILQGEFILNLSNRRYFSGSGKPE